jgi:hypothetical protein
MRRVTTILALALLLGGASFAHGQDITFCAASVFSPIPPNDASSRDPSGSLPTGSIASSAVLPPANAFQQIQADKFLAAQPAPPLVSPTVLEAAPSTCGNCFCRPKAACDGCPTGGLQAFVGYDAWRGVSDDSWENNGIHTGLNYGSRLGRISDLTGVGFQVGGSVGVYDWSGTDYRPNSQAALTQGFLTYGFFRRPNEDCNWTAGIAQDWMFASNFGDFGQNVTLSQWRAQVGYALGAKNEVGLWGTWHCTSQNQNVPGIGPTSWRTVNLLAPYWHHKWWYAADTWLWVGAPVGNRLTGDGTLGSWLASASATVPFNDHVGLYTNITYMRPSARASAVASEEEFWNFTIGLTFYPRPVARSRTVAGRCWMPMMPMANNGNFMVDTTNH